MPRTTLDRRNRQFINLCLCLGLTALAGCTGRPVLDADGDAAVSDAADARADLVLDAVLPDTPDVPLADAVDRAVTDATDAADATDVTDVTDGGCRFTRVIVGVSDYSAFGGYVVGDLGAPGTLHLVPLPDAGASAVDQDHNVRGSATRCETYDLWHSSPARVVTLDPANVTAHLRTLTLAEVSAGPDGGAVSANPYDLAVISATKAYVVQYNSAQIAVIDPGAGTVTAHISLASLADADGIPEAASITVLGGRAYVSLQQLDRPGGYTVPAHSHIAVIDTATDRLVDVNPATPAIDGITLSHGNPTGDMPRTDDGLHLLVVSIGSYGDPASGVDVIDVATNTVTRTIDSLALGGKPSSVAVVTGSTAWTTVDRAGDAGAMHAILAFDLATGVVTASPVAASTVYTYSSLRRAPDGSVWSIGGDYGLGSIHAFTALGVPRLAVPFTTGALNTTSLDFLP